VLGRDTERSDVVSSASQLATCCLAYSGMMAGVEERVKEDGGREGGKEGRREEGERRMEVGKEGGAGEGEKEKEREQGEREERRRVVIYL